MNLNTTNGLSQEGLFFFGYQMLTPQPLQKVDPTKKTVHFGLRTHASNNWQHLGLSGCRHVTSGQATN